MSDDELVYSWVKSVILLSFAPFPTFSFTLFDMSHNCEMYELLVKKIAALFIIIIIIITDGHFITFDYIVINHFQTFKHNFVRRISPNTYKLGP